MLQRHNGNNGTPARVMRERPVRPAALWSWSFFIFNKGGWLIKWITKGSETTLGVHYPMNGFMINVTWWAWMQEKHLSSCKQYALKLAFIFSFVWSIMDGTLVTVYHCLVFDFAKTGQSNIAARPKTNCLLCQEHKQYLFCSLLPMISPWSLTKHWSYQYNISI